MNAVNWVSAEAEAMATGSWASGLVAARAAIEAPTRAVTAAARVAAARYRLVPRKRDNESVTGMSRSYEISASVKKPCCDRHVGTKAQFASYSPITTRG
ncbi:hypothetical protein GCM10027262_58500 [Nocardia tengchongensis]